jgi:peptidoglycan/LPS O-acetylase OafA/YrhL
LQSSGHNLSYRPDIDGLRALAVLPVVGFHAFPGRVPGGFIGVDIFFVISGFLISTILLKEMERGTYSLRKFYVRRIRRIFPALIVVLLATLALGSVLLLPNEMEQLTTHVIAGALFASNFVLWNEVGYFDAAAELKPLLHLWSLGVEEQFYIVWPLALSFLFRLGRRLVVAIAIATMASFLLNIYFVSDDPTIAFYSPLTRFWELLLGAIIAASGYVPRGPRTANAMSFAGMGLIIGSIAIINVNMRYPGWWAAMPTAGAVFIIAAGPASWCNRHLLSNRIAVWFGLISYPLYLWHWPLLSFLSITDLIKTENALRLARLAIIVVSVILAWATYRLLEIRVRKTKPPAFVAGLVTTMAAVCGIAVLTGIGASQSDQTRASDFYWGSARLQTSDCIAKYGLRPSKNLFCVETDPNIAPSVLVIGDSHSNHWVPGVKAQDGRGILNIGEGTCPFFERVYVTGSIKKDCERTMARAYEVAKNSPSITTVVLSMRATLPLPGSAYGIMKGEPTVTYLLAGATLGDDVIKSNSNIYAHELRYTLAKLTALGKDIIFVFQLPEHGFEPQSCVRLRPFDAFKEIRVPCTTERADPERRQHDYRALSIGVLEDFPNVKVLDPFPIICDPESCKMQEDGKFLYRDHDHVSVEGSIRVWRAMIAQQSGLTISATDR